MALRLAGEPILVVRGVSNQGWVREITVQDSLAGLKINQQGTGRVFDFQDGGVSKVYLPDGGALSLAADLDFQQSATIRTTSGNLTMDPAGTINPTKQIFFDNQALNNPILARRNSTNDIALERYTNDTAGPGITFKKARGTIASPTAAANDDALGRILWWGHDGSAFQLGTEIDGEAEETWSGTARGSRIRMDVIVPGTTTLVTGSRIRGNIADGETALELRRNLSSVLTLQRVTMGAPDSGGAGYRALRVPN